MSRRPLSVGLTGGLASGKSTVARLLAERGAAVSDADAVVADLYRPGAPGAEALAGALGARVLNREGAVDRAVLSRLIASEDGVLATVNRLVHPLVRAEVDRWLAGVAAAVAVIEATLLVETGAWRRYDRLVVVSCTAEQQRTRALDRGMDPDRVETLLAAQAPLVDKCAVADFIVDNSGPPEALAAEVDRAWAWIQAEAEGRDRDR